MALVAEGDVDRLRAVPDVVEEPVAVAREVDAGEGPGVAGLLAPRARPAAERARAVGGPGVGVEEHLLGAFLPLLPVDHRLLLGGVPARVEVAAAAVGGGAEQVDVEELLEARGDGVALGELL